MLGRAGLFVLVATAACRAGSGGGLTVSTPPAACGTAHDAPIANIGPEITVHAPCGGRAVGAIASVDEPGAGVVQWLATISGDPAISLDPGTEMTFESSHMTGPVVAFVVFSPPLDSKPGDSFDAVVTVNDACGDFPEGSVKVHAEVGLPVVMVAPVAIDFGDVPVGSTARQGLLFRNEDTNMVSVGVSVATPPFQYDLPLATALDPGMSATSFVSVSPSTLGDFSTVSVWEISTFVIGGLPDGGWPAGCAGMVSLPVHVHVVPADAGADGGDGSVEAPGDQPPSSASTAARRSWSSGGTLISASLPGS
jgi:hypothetical protein